MCLLIVLRGIDSDFPVLVASNRDEACDRPSSPPGLWVGERRRVLSPRDKRAGGTWLGVNDGGMFAGITNAPGPDLLDAATRGRLPHLALDQDDAQAAAEVVLVEVERAPTSPFHLVLCDASAMVVVHHGSGRTHATTVAGDCAILSNEHALGELHVPGIEAARAPQLSAAERLEALRPLLLDEGGASGHPVLKRGPQYGTVSSSLIAVHRDQPRALLWRYAPGPPDQVDYRNYGNLGRRLVDA